VNALLAAGSASDGPWVWLGGAVSASILLAAVVKVGRWISTVEARIDRHDAALRRIGKALADDPDDRTPEGSS
jgi:hypothetical protein